MHNVHQYSQVGEKSLRERTVVPCMKGETICYLEVSVNESLNEQNELP